MGLKVEDKSKMMEIKRKNKVLITNYIFKSVHTSKVDISHNLGISMPTVLQNIKELIDAGIVEEIGDYQSTGGRKAKALSIVGTAAMRSAVILRYTISD